MEGKVLDFDMAEDCTGCSACASVCPSGAITLVSDERGFLVPSVDEDACIRCRKCERVCQALTRSNVERPSFIAGYVFSSSNQDVLSTSASGGAFAELARGAIDANGLVAGCAWSSDIQAEHRLTDELDRVADFASSKYVQSNVRGIYAAVKRELESGRKVVFGGTPCQVEALGRCCGKSRENLLAVSVVCRGASSPGVWEAYKRGLEASAESKLVSVNQRDKTRGYGRSMCHYKFKNGTTVDRATYVSDLYTNCFANGITLRGSCHHCPAKGYHFADVIVGDDVLGAGSSKGATLVLCVTQKGSDWIKRLLSSRGRLVELSSDQVALVSEKSNMLFGSSGRHDEASARLFNDIDAGMPADKALMRSLPPKQKLKVRLDRAGLFSLARALKVRMNG